jgi:hypothetical protein
MPDIFHKPSGLTPAGNPVLKAKIVAISDTPNSFGLHGHVIATRDGHAYEVARSKGHGSGNWSIDRTLLLPLSPTGRPAWAPLGAEIPRYLGQVPPNLHRTIWLD